MTASDLRQRSKLPPVVSGKYHEDRNKKNSDYDSGHISFFFYSTAVIVTCIKFLLIPAYHSTDLEVHRNWMAITYNKPLIEWYSENTSQWTLDYPPFFAYFEYFLAYFAKFFDENMLRVQCDPYMSPSTLFYLRLTVIISDLVYYYGVYLWIRLMYQRKPQLFVSVPSMKARSNFFLSSTLFIQIILFLFNVGHLIVDHVHFQYNGFFNGLLLISMARICNQQIYWGSFLFAVLLNFKHIYFYMAPAYCLYLFIEYCLIRNQNGYTIKISFNTLIRLAVVVIGVFFASFLPFIINGQIWNVLNRMFPFQRGLSHAYWAPNIWALYNTYDLLAARFYRITSRQSPFTTGLVQQSEHLVLPSITPSFILVCVLIILTAITYIYIWKHLTVTSKTSKQSPENRSNNKMRNPEIRFLHLVLLSSLTFYEFGYHVHEKSILLIVPTLIPLIFVNIDYARMFLLLSTAGYYSLFPLLFKEAEAPLKLLLMAIHLIFSFTALNSRYRIVKQWTNNDQDNNYNSNDYKSIDERPFSFFCLPLLDLLESIYIYGFIFIHLIYSFGYYIVPSVFERFPFLPLMLVSLYCSVGILYGYWQLFQMFFREILKL